MDWNCRILKTYNLCIEEGIYLIGVIQWDHLQYIVYGSVEEKTGLEACALTFGQSLWFNDAKKCDERFQELCRREGGVWLCARYCTEFVPYDMSLDDLDKFVGNKNLNEILIDLGKNINEA